MTPDELKEMISKFGTSVGTLTTTVSTLSTKLGGGLTKLADNFEVAAKSIAQAGAGIVAMNAGSEQAYVVFRKFAGMVGIPDQLSEGIIQASKDLKSSVGAGQADTIMQATLNAAIMMKTRDEMVKYTSGLGSNLLALGGTTREAQQNLVDLTKSVLDTDKIQKLVKLGMDPAAIADFTAGIAIANRLNLKDAKDRERLTQLTVEYADTLIEQSQRMNVPITQLNESIQKKRVGSEGTTEELMKNMLTKEQRVGFEQATQRLQETVGPGITLLVQRLATNAKLSDEDRKIYSVMSNEIGMLQRAMSQSIRGTPEERAKALADIDNVIIPMIAKRLNSAEIGALGSKGSDAISATINKLLSEVKIRQGLRPVAENETEGDYIAANQRLRAQTQNIIEGKDPKTGERRTDRTAEELVAEAEKLARTNTINFAKELKGMVEKLDQTAVKGFKDELAKVNKEFENKKPIEDFVNIFKGIFPKPEENKADTAPKTEQENAMERARKNTTRAHGTLSATGELKEPKDILSLLHKGERVLNPNENNDLNEVFNTLKNFKPSSVPMVDPSQIIEQLNVKLPKQIMDKISVSGIQTPPPAPILPDFSAFFRQMSVPPQIKMPFDVNALIESTKAKTERSLNESRPAEPAPVATPRPVFGENNNSMNELLRAVNQLNTTMNTMLDHTVSINENSRTTSRMAGKLTGNRLYG